MADADCEKANASKQAVINQQTQVIQAQDKEIADLQKDQSSVLKSPVLWFFVGVAVTGLGAAALGSLHR